MPDKLQSPSNFTITPGNKSAQAQWDEVPGAAGYIVDVCKADSPDINPRHLYTQTTDLLIHGLQNGENYLASVEAFEYKDNAEVHGVPSELLIFAPIASCLTSQRVISMSEGESTYIEWEYRNSKPQVKFSSSNTEVAAVTQEGMVTGYSAGTSWITLTSSELPEGENTWTVKVIVDRTLPVSTVRHTTIMIGGALDAMPGAQSKLASKGYDFNCIFSPEIRHIISGADYSAVFLDTVCDDHNAYTSEAPRMDSGLPYSNCPSTLIEALGNAGVDGVFTAVPHNFDCGKRGLKSTRSHIRSLGMNPIGASGDNPVIKVIGNIRVAFISLSMHSNHLDDEVEDKYTTLGRFSESNVEALIATAHEKKADFIIATMYWGTPGSLIVNPSQQITAQFLAEQGVDIIIGSGTNVSQAYEELTTSDGRIVPCIYSLGSLFTETSTLYENTLSLIANIILSEDSNSYSCRVTLIPVTQINRNEIPTIVPAVPGITQIQEDAYNYVHSFYPEVMFEEYLHGVLLIQGSRSMELLSEHLNSTHKYSDNNPNELTLARYNYIAFDICSFLESPAPERDLSTYLTLLSSVYPRERLILVRHRYESYGVKNNAIVDISYDSEMANKLQLLEEFVISSIHPVVIDLTELFLPLADEDGLIYEDYFYRQCGSILDSIPESKKIKIYYSDPDANIWIERCIAYHASLQEHEYKNTLLGDQDAADIIIQNSDVDFITYYKEQLLYLKALHIELPFVEGAIPDTEYTHELLVKVSELMQE